MLKYHISELIDAEKLQKLMKSFREMTHMTCTLTDPEGNVLMVNDEDILSSGWQRICKEYHKKHPLTFEKCIESDTILSKQLLKHKRYSLYKCRNGLVDCAIPIYIENQHVVNLFTGQFFLEPPDMTFFRKQASEYGFSEEEYLTAVSEVPVLDKKTVEQGILFLADLATLITHMGFKERELLELKNNLEKKVDERTINLEKALEEIKSLEGIIPICMHCKQIRDDQGFWRRFESYIESHSKAKFSHSICDKCLDELYPEEGEE